MALFHLSVTQVKRSAGQSAIASAAYRAGERLYSEYYGEYSDYTRKGGVICSDILLPPQAPPDVKYLLRAWTAVLIHQNRIFFACGEVCRLYHPAIQFSALFFGSGLHGYKAVTT